MAFDIIIGRTEEDRKKFADKGTIFLGKSYVKMGQTTSLSNPVHLDVTKAHVVFLIGKRGGGKSYSAGVVAEGIVDLPEDIAKNIAVIMLDTMGVYWTMKYPNEKDADLLEKWGLQPKGLEKIRIFTPIGKFEETKAIGIPTDFPFSIKASELTGEDWRLAFELDISHPVTILIEKILGDLAERKINSYDIETIIEMIRKDQSFTNETKNEAINRFKTATKWGLFSNEGTAVDVLVKGGAVSILDLSAYATAEGGWGVKSLVIGLIAKKIFIERMVSRQLEEIEAIKVGYSYFKIQEESESKEKKPLVWFLLDEAHEYLPAEGKTAATDALVAILREGRQPGISLLLITQQPGKIHSDVLTQSDIVIAHRITARRDVDALNSMMQSYLGDTLTGYLNILPSEPGAAIILDDNSERLYPIRVRPKFSWHGGEAPTAIKYKRSMNLGI
ncbi:ATP-binding protein [Candidatus Woesearchaeota archaeon]|nr:ATP-binding protein [Candidatus Woesearchaeota archaeon]